MGLNAFHGTVAMQPGPEDFAGSGWIREAPLPRDPRASRPKDITMRITAASSVCADSRMPDFMGSKRPFGILWVLDDYGSFMIIWHMGKAVNNKETNEKRHLFSDHHGLKFLAC